MENSAWSDLIDTIKEGYCILLLGPHLITETIEGKKIPLSKLLAEELANHIKLKGEEIIDADNLMQIAQQYQNMRTIRILQTSVKEFYSRKENIEIPLSLRHIASLPFKHIIYSTHDDLLCKAFREGNKEPICEFYEYKGDTKDVIEGSVKAPLIFHLYGIAVHSHSIVISESGILEFLVNVIKGDPPLPGYLQTIFSDKKSKYCFLFLGFGINNWYLRVMIHALFGTGREIPSYALEKIDSTASKEFKQMILFYEKGYKIYFHNDNQDQFIEELLEKFNKDKVIKKTTDFSSPPVVFLCHASEDKVTADKLSNQLKKRGIEPWIDKDNLRGGDLWDKRLMEVIKKEIDYFVVLMSRKMEIKKERYFIKEITVAKDRSKSFPDELSFVIPLKIEECNIISKLEESQVIDFNNTIDIDELIRIIKQDIKIQKGVF